MKFFSTFLITCSVIFAGVFDFETISSEFKQTITNEENSKIIYKGNFYATNKAKALWIYTSPIDKKIYFINDKVIIIEPELEQAIITNIKNSPNLTEILKKSIKKSKNTFQTTYDDTIYTVKTKANMIEEIIYNDKLGNSVKIELFNQTINTILDDVLFKATIPKDFDIITQ